MLKINRAVTLVWQSSPFWTTIHSFVAIVQTLLPLIQLYLIKLIVDSIASSLKGTSQSQNFNHILFLLMGTGIVMLLTNFAAVIAELVSTTLSQRVTDYMQVVLYRKAIEIDLESYENPQYQDILERAKWEAPHRPTRMLNNLTSIGQSALSLIVVAGLLITMHWGLISILVVASMPMMLLRVQQSKALYKWQRHQTELERKANYFGHLLLGDSPAKEIRLFNIGNLLIEWVQELRQQLLREKLALITRQASARLLMQGITSLAVLAAYGFMIEQTLQGKFQLGDLVLYSQALQRGQGALKDLIGNLASLHENHLFLADLYEFLAIQPTIAKPLHPTTVPNPFRRGIVFENVSFRYQNSARFALKHINLSIQPGEVIALVGENGSGKTTLVKLLTRLYDVTEGRITIDGIDIRHFSPDDLHRQISVIFQDYTRYQFSAQDNIWLGNIELPITSDRIVQSAHQSGADAVIQTLPQGYNTLLGKWFKGGEELSGGQWQKIALARAFLREAQLVVLDEPTSAMDAKAEAEVFQKFRDLMRDRSALLITHRLSTVKMADRIYVMDQGRITESGTHDQLMARRGTYAHLFEIQAKHYQ
ncbi:MULTISPECIES: ABC transporter ATP-binding protein [Leptolyngbya]|uniref:ABC transporter ATP-binding protein n=1 Tax=Leptolyngbya TaxID=47251 RepID=UPI0016889C3E|nr:ABC transporter ATP-binding protein [Leptolyngbya sp. FACHB-1624]MBD1859235.1 ABC transporter ATP-binding protein [Leptolyngbya sp. FACHB-1624]